MVNSTIQHAPSHPSHTTISIYCTFSLRRGEGGGGQREGTVEGQQNTSIFPSSTGATAHKLGRKY
jgi:hypothetical protein